jgi:uncharacterized protein (TIGR00730 family)
MNIRSIALFCGSSCGQNNLYRTAARDFGKICADKKITLYFGGGSIGLMAEACQAARSANGKVIGIAPRFFASGNVLDPNIEMLWVDSMSERKQLLEKQADAFVILPGGFGTMDELFEVLTDAQLGLHQKPVAILNVNSFYDLLTDQLSRFVEEGFLKSFHLDLLLVANNLDSLFEQLQNYQYTNDRNWLDKIKK